MLIEVMVCLRPVFTNATGESLGMFSCVTTPCVTCRTVVKPALIRKLNRFSTNVADVSVRFADPAISDFSLLFGKFWRRCDYLWIRLVCQLGLAERFFCLYWRNNLLEGHFACLSHHCYWRKSGRHRPQQPGEFSLRRNWLAIQRTLGDNPMKLHNMFSLFFIFVKCHRRDYPLDI